MDARAELKAVAAAGFALALGIASFAVAGAIVDDGGSASADAADGAPAATTPDTLGAVAQNDDEHDDEHDGAHDGADGSVEISTADGHAHDDPAHADDHATGTHDDDHDTTGGDHSHTTTPAGGTTPHDHGTTPAGGTTPHDDGHDHTPVVPAGNGTTPTTHGGHSHPTPSTTPNTTGGSTTPTTHGGHDHGTTTTLPPGATTTTTAPGGTTTTTVHHHGGHNVQLADLPPAVQAQITSITNWAMQYDTTAKATAAGYPQLTLYFPGIAAHYVDLGRLFDGKPFDQNDVEVLLFNGTGPGADLVGINYIVESGDTPPEGFAGDYDVWHAHPTLCLGPNLIVVGEVGPGEHCPAGQTDFPFDGFWLLHVWSIPGWESPEGIFSHENSRV